MPSAITTWRSAPSAGWRAAADPMPASGPPTISIPNPYRWSPKRKSLIQEKHPMKRVVPFLRVGAVVAVISGGLRPQPGGGRAPADQAALVVRGPADATLMIGGQTFTQTGPERRLITPALKAGKTYSYELFAIWKVKEKGKKEEVMTVSRTVNFQAGQTVMVDLTKPAPVVKDGDKKDADKKDAKKDADKKDAKKDADKKDAKKDADKDATKGKDKKNDKTDVEKKDPKKDADKNDAKKDGEKKPVEVWTNPEAPSLPVDFAIQGEYAGDGFGVQVIALGGGNFQAVVLPGGLPGAGWDGKNKTLLDGTLQGGKVAFKAEAGKRSYLAKSPAEFSATAKFPPAGHQDFYAASADGKTMLLTLSGRAVTLDKTQRKSPTLGQKPPQGATVLFDGSGAEE